MEFPSLYSQCQQLMVNCYFSVVYPTKAPFTFHELMKGSLTKCLVEG